MVSNCSWSLTLLKMEIDFTSTSIHFRDNSKTQDKGNLVGIKKRCSIYARCHFEIWNTGMATGKSLGVLEHPRLTSELLWQKYFQQPSYYRNIWRKLTLQSLCTFLLLFFPTLLKPFFRVFCTALKVKWGRNWGGGRTVRAGAEYDN